MVKNKQEKVSGRPSIYDKYIKIKEMTSFGP